MSCVGRRQGTHGLAPTSADRSSRDDGNYRQTTRGRPLVNERGLRAPRRQIEMLFNVRDANFKLFAFVDFAVLEAAELFVNVVDLHCEPIESSVGRRNICIDCREFCVHVSSQVGDLLVHACEVSLQSRVDNVFDLIQIVFVHTGEVYHTNEWEHRMSAQKKPRFAAGL